MSSPAQSPVFDEVILLEDVIALRRKPRTYHAPNNLTTPAYPLEFCVWLQANFDQLVKELNHD